MKFDDLKPGSVYITKPHSTYFQLCTILKGPYGKYEEIYEKVIERVDVEETSIYIKNGAFRDKGVHISRHNGIAKADTTSFEEVNLDPADRELIIQRVFKYGIQYDYRNN